MVRLSKLGRTWQDHLNSKGALSERMPIEGPRGAGNRRNGSGALMAKPGHAEYMREWRKTVKPLNERDAREAGFKAGVAACVKLIRERAGDRELTGYQTARLLESVVASESFEVRSRRELVKSLQPAS